MASVGFKLGKYGAHMQLSVAEGKKAAIPGMFICTTLGFVGLSGLLIYRKYKTASTCEINKNQYAHEINVIKANGEKEKDVYENKKANDILATITLSALRKDQDENDRTDGEEKIEPTMRQASDIPLVDGHYDDHQLVGTLLYREDICLCYGEEHIGKTSIILNWIIDIVLGKKSRLMPDDKGIHPPYQCLWYNGEMNEPDFQNFFGNYERSRLDGRLFFIDDFAHMNLYEWLKHVRERLRNCHSDTIVVLDNISCICNSTDVEVKSMRNKIASIQKEVRTEQGIHVTFLIIDHINKKGLVAGTYKLKALFSTRIRFSSYGEGHTKISIEKNRKYHYMINKSFDLLWTTSPEGYKSFENLGEIIEDGVPVILSDSDLVDEDDEEDDPDDRPIPDARILEFHEIVREKGNISEASRQLSIHRKHYYNRIDGLIEAGKCKPIPGINKKWFK